MKYLSAIKSDLYLCRFKGGIQLNTLEKITWFRSNNIPVKPIATVGDILNMPFCVYFNTCDHNVIELNSAGCRSVGGLPLSNASGYDLSTFLYNKKEAEPIISNNEQVIKKRKLRVFEEKVQLKNMKFIHTISYKLPWFDHQEEVAGILGCSILVSPAESVSMSKYITIVSNLFIRDARKKEV